MINSYKKWFENHSALTWALNLFLLIFVVIIAGSILLLKVGAIGSDAYAYLEAGRGMFHGNNYIEYNLADGRAPLFSLLFALSFHIFGLSLDSALLLLKLITIGSIFLLFLLSKKIYGPREALASVILVSMSVYMITFPTKFFIDQTMAFFILLCLYLLVLSFTESKIHLSVVAGISLGAALLVKEAAIEFTPFPLYLLLVSPGWWTKKSLLSLFGYFMGVSFFPVIWWIYYYTLTGEIFLFGSIPPIILQILKWSIIVIPLFAIIGYMYSKRKNVISRYLIVKYPSILKVAPWLIWILITFLFTIGLSWRTPIRFDKQPDIFFRITSFASFFERRILVENPQFHFLLPALIIIFLWILAKKQNGDRILFWSVLTCVPLMLTAYWPGEFELASRYFMLFYWLGYLALGRALIIALDLASFLFSLLIKIITRNQFRNVFFTNIIIVLLAFYSVYVVWQTTSSYEYTYPSPRNFNVDGVRNTIQWIKDNISKEATIASGGNYFRAYNFHLDGNVKQLIFTPYQQDVRIYLLENELKLYSKLDVGESTPFSRPIYTQFSEFSSYVDYTNNVSNTIRIPRFSMLSEQELIEYIKSNHIDYLIFPEAVHPRTMHLIPDYFIDHPAFKRVFVSRWQEGINKFAIHIFQVDRARLSDDNYPLIITSEAWLYLNNRVKVLKDGQDNLFDTLHALGNSPIIFRPASKNNYRYYLNIADAYLQQEEIELATFEYHLALSELSNKAPDIPEIAERLILEYPDNAGPWLLAGDIYYYKGDYDLAHEAYQHGLAALHGESYTFSAMHKGLGRLYLARNQNLDAIEEFETAIRLNKFGASDTHLQILLAQANLYQVNGDIDQSIAAYKQALELQSLFPVEYHHQNRNSYLKHDFVQAFNQSQVIAEDITQTHPSVSIFDNQPIAGLFAHPKSEIRFKVEVPPRASLAFAPALVPEVWGLGKGDGVLFEVFLETADNNYRLFSRYIDPKNIPGQRIWIEENINLSQWAGESVTIKFITGSGPNNDARFDWAVWGEPRIVQAISFDFLDNLPTATLGDGVTNLQVREDIFSIEGEPRDVLFVHPSNQVAYSLNLPEQSTLAFGIGMDPEVWTPAQGDGVIYKVLIRPQDQPNMVYEVFQRYIDPKNNSEDRRWFDERVDLSQFGGQTVDIIFEALPGPNGNANFDWGGWSRPVLLDETVHQEADIAEIPQEDMQFIP